MGAKPATAHVWLGIDVGSVTTKAVAVGETGAILAHVCHETMGQPARQVVRGLIELGSRLAEVRRKPRVRGVGTTGSGRSLAAALVGGDVVKNEITAHAVAALDLVPDVRTVLEIGGQDSKIILLRDGGVSDFAMNTVCAAGTGSFLDRQAARLGLAPAELGELALRSKRPVRIAGRCAVFAETDMVHQQQIGHAVEDIVAGLCQALVRNYLNNLAKGKDLEPPFVFQGGVAANRGMVAAFEGTLGHPVTVPEHHALMGAFGAALLAKEAGLASTRFRGFGLGRMEHRTASFDCDGCPNECEITELRVDGAVAARWGGRCERWQRDGSPAREAGVQA